MSRTPYEQGLEEAIEYAKKEHPNFDPKSRIVEFPFVAWAAANKFAYPAEATEFLERCGSAAEAFFARAFAIRDGVTFSAGGLRATCGALKMGLQVPCGGYRVDAVIVEGRFRLAIEIDGLVHHWRHEEQVASDYARERAIVATGYTLIRFTAKEAWRTPKACWDAVNAVLLSRRSM